MSFQQSSAPDGAGQARVNLRGKRQRRKAFYALRFCLLLIQLKKRLLIVIPRLTRNPASSSTVTFGN